MLALPPVKDANGNAPKADEATAQPAVGSRIDALPAIQGQPPGALTARGSFLQEGQWPGSLTARASLLPEVPAKTVGAPATSRKAGSKEPPAKHHHRHPSKRSDDQDGPITKEEAYERIRYLQAMQQKDQMKRTPPPPQSLLQQGEDDGQGKAVQSGALAVRKGPTAIFAMNHMRRPGQDRRPVPHRPADKPTSPATAPEGTKVQEKSSKESPSAFLPKVIGSVCPPNLFHSHPFFRGLTEEFREALSARTQRQRFDNLEEDEFAHQRRNLMRGNGLLHDLFEQRVELKQVLTLTAQGELPLPKLDGLHITFASDSDETEAFYNNVAMSVTPGTFVYGAETSLGVSERSMFTVRLKREPLQGMFFLPRETLRDIMELKCFMADAKMLKERAQKAVETVLYEWYVRNFVKVKIRLFANMSLEFRQEVIQCSTVGLWHAGAVLRKVGQISNTCFCVVQGEAEVSVGETKLVRVSSSGSYAWASWWGFLETLGSSGGLPSVVEVKAVTDSIIWEISSTSLADLRDAYPTECGYFDKVALKHLQMLAPFATNFMNVPILRDCDRTFLATLSNSATFRGCLPGEAIITEHEQGDEMFVLVRGICSVFRSSCPEAINHLYEGATFGELAVLGVSRTRTASIICDTVCDVRVLDRASLTAALAHFPAEAVRLEQITQAHGYSRKIATEELSKNDMFKDFSDAFVKMLADCFYEQPFFVGQTLIRQDHPGHHMYVLVHGEVEILVNDTRVCVVSAPAVLGESAVLMPGHRSTATVRSVTVCDCLAVHTDRVSAQLHQQFPEDMSKIHALLNQKKEGISKHLTAKQTTEAAPKRFTERASRIERNDRRASRSFFVNGNPDFLADLTQRFERCVYFDGQTIMEEGVEGKRAVVIEQGNCVVEVAGARVGEVGAGELLGEVVLLGQSSHHTATVRAVGMVVAFAISMVDMAECLERYPQERQKIIEVMQERQKASAGVANLQVKMVGAVRGSNAQVHFVRRAQSIKPRRTNMGDDMRSSISVSSRKSSRRGAKKSFTWGPDGPLSAREVSRPGRVDDTDSAGSSSDDDDDDESAYRSRERKALGPLRGPADIERWLQRRRQAMARAEAARQLRVIGDLPVPSRQGYVVAEMGHGTAFAALKATSAATSRAASSAAVAAATAQAGGEGGSPGVAKLAVPSLPTVPVPSALRMKKTESVYGRPVWFEVFGGPVTVQ